jgi:hypothetical protein
MVRGTVLETMNSGGYTYAFMDTGQDQRWVAALETPVTVGDVVQTDEGMAMSGFTSKTLNRTFNVVYFVSTLQNLSGGSPPSAQASGEMPQGHPDISAGAATTAVAAIEAYEEGKDIAYVYHIQDGSGDAAAGSNDLIVTTKADTAVGETIVLSGTIALDKDFGAGYSYPVLLEDASISSE